mgnify:FL=1
MTYLVLKYLHVACVVLSGLGFSLRGWWMLNDSPQLKTPLARVVPHVIDSVLLGSALLMAWQSSQYPFAQGWLTAKFFGLLACLLCGARALMRARAKGRRGAFLVLALLAYAYIVGVALTRNPLL